MPCLDSVARYRVQKIQNSCLRLVYGVRRGNHLSPYLLDSGWLNMFNRSRLHMATFYFKLLTNRSQTYLCQKVVFRADVHNINLHTKISLTVPKHRKEIFKRSFSYNITRLINTFNNFNNDQSPSTFKCMFKRQLLLSQV